MSNVKSAKMFDYVAECYDTLRRWRQKRTTVPSVDMADCTTGLQRSPTVNHYLCTFPPSPN